MKKNGNPQDRLVLLFDQKKCWTIEELTLSRPAFYEIGVSTGMRFRMSSNPPPYPARVEG